MGRANSKLNRMQKSEAPGSWVHANIPPSPARPTVTKEKTQPLKSSMGNMNSGLVYLFTAETQTQRCNTVTYMSEATGKFDTTD